MLQETLKIPIACCGDVFDKWNASAKLCNFLLDILPEMIAIPGQHDLPYHSYDLIEDSGFANLFKAGKIKMLSVGSFIGIFAGAIEIHGFGWEQPLKSPTANNCHSSTTKNVIKIAIVHKYVHTGGGTCYTGAPENNYAWRLSKQLEGFDLAFFGDNHTPFEWGSNNLKHPLQSNCPKIYNCGSFIRRKSDEGHIPSVLVVYSDKHVERYFLDSTNNDIIDHAAKDKAPSIDPEAVFSNPELIQEILNTSNSDKPIKFTEAVRHALINNNIGRHIQKIVLEALEGKR